MWIVAAALCAGCESSTPIEAPPAIDTVTTAIDTVKTALSGAIDTVPTAIDTVKTAPPKPRLVGKPVATQPEQVSSVASQSKVTSVASVAILPTPNGSAVMVPAPGMPRPTSCKPEAPVAVAIASHQQSTNRYELTITATPSAPVDSVVLELVVPAGATADRMRATFAATRTGEARVLTAIVTTTAETTDVAGVARVPVAAGDRGAPIVMSRSTAFVLGAPHAQPVTRTYALPDGESAREVRP
jgi:hypothetical protein